MEVAQRYELLTLFALCTLLTLLRDAVRKKTGLCGKNSQTGGWGGSDPNPLLDVFTIHIYHPKIVIFW